MKFRNYCIVIMGKTDGCKLEIGKIAEDSPRFLDAKGITISTFVSVAEPGELSDYFKQMGRNFMIFDMDQQFSGYHLTNDKLHDALFGHITSELDVELEQMSNRLIDEIHKTSEGKSTSGATKNPDKGDKIVDLAELRKKQVKAMGLKEREELLNNIIDKGPENLTNLDKEILEFLTKNT